MRKRLFGLNRKDADNYLAKVKKENEEKLLEAKKKIEGAVKGREKLNDELQQLQNENEQLKKDKYIIGMAEKRLEKALARIEGEAADEVSNLKSLTKDKHDAANVRINKTKEEIDASKDAIKRFLDSVKNLLDSDEKDKNEKENESKQQLPGKHSSKVIQYPSRMAKIQEEAERKEKQQEEKNLKEAGKQNETEIPEKEAIKEEAKKALKEAASAETEEIKIEVKADIKEEIEEEVKDEVKEEVKNEKVKVAALNEQYCERENFWEAQEAQKMTADGLVLDNKANSNKINLKSKNETSGKVASDSAGKVKQVSARPASEFWEDSDEDMADAGQVAFLSVWNKGRKQEAVIQHQGNITAAVKIAGAETAAAAEIKLYEKREPVAAELKPKKTINEIEASDEASRVKPASAAKTGQSPEMMRSPAITAEITSIRHKYIVGKLAGENLYDSEGNIIISKNSVITDSTVARAEKEGKLSELIINMIMPGLE